MIALHITPNIDDAPWEDLNGPDGEAPELPLIVRIAGLPGGMMSGLPAVAVAIQQGDGTWVCGQTSLRQLLLACNTIKTSLIVRGLLDEAAWEVD